MLSEISPTKRSSGWTELMSSVTPGLIGTKVEPLLNSLHKDPRYAALLKKLNLPN